MALSTNYDSATTYHSGFVKETLPSMNYNVNSADMQTVLMDADLFFTGFTAGFTELAWLMRGVTMNAFAIL